MAAHQFHPPPLDPLLPLTSSSSSSFLFHRQLRRHSSSIPLDESRYYRERYDRVLRGEAKYFHGTDVLYFRLLGCFVPPPKPKKTFADPKSLVFSFYNQKRTRAQLFRNMPRCAFGNCGIENISHKARVKTVNWGRDSGRKAWFTLVK